MENIETLRGLHVRTRVRGSGGYVAGTAGHVQLWRISGQTSYRVELQWELRLDIPVSALDDTATCIQITSTGKDSLQYRGDTI